MREVGARAGRRITCERQNVRVRLGGFEYQVKQPGRFRDRKHEDRTLESVRFQGSRDEYIGINNKPERDHPRLGFGARAALMTWSIWRELSLSVPFRCDSSPMTRSTSGSGAASRR